jgi:hypothetical protein
MWNALELNCLLCSEMASQANLLVERMTRALGAGKFAADWKLVTFFIGGNDLCSSCKDIVRRQPYFTRCTVSSTGRIDTVQPITRTTSNKRSIS